MNTEATILIVDDERANLQVLGNILTRYNYQIAAASNGRDAIQIATEIKPDIILLDVMMPILDGFETCKEIKSNPELSNIPVLFITALDQTDEMVKGFNLGAVDYITKPFNSRVLASRLKTHILLKKKTEELEQLNRTLEQKVEERTLELDKANKELTKLDEVKTEFLSIISHEIRTPLNGILGFTELISRSIKDNSINQYIEALNTSAKRLERFSINALRFTFLKSGKYLLETRNVHLNQLLDEVICECQHQLNNKNIQINQNVPESLVIKAEKNLMKASFLSVLENAIRFSPDKSTISINSINNCEFVHVKIIDEGSGFSEKAMNALFKPFAPGEKFFNENEGMELALASLIMKTHQGTLSVRNLEKGAEVEFIIKK